MTGAELTRTCPEVPEQRLNDFKVAIRVFNEGKLKGRLSPSFAEAIQLYLVSMYAREPGRLKHLRQYVDPDEVKELDDPEAYRERVLRYQDQVAGASQEIAHQLQRERPGGPTRFEEYLSLDDSEDDASLSQSAGEPSVLQSPLITDRR